jgi:toxin YoeB
MEVKYMPEAIVDIAFFKKSGNKALLKKIQNLIFELEQNPYEGTGKVERLKGNLSGYWSRRINSEHRIVYQIIEIQQIVEIYSLRGHY